MLGCLDDLLLPALHLVSSTRSLTIVHDSSSALQQQFFFPLRATAGLLWQSAHVAELALADAGDVVATTSELYNSTAAVTLLPLVVLGRAHQDIHSFITGAVASVKRDLALDAGINATVRMLLFVWTFSNESSAGVCTCSEVRRRLDKS